ncbi:hypothetical protein Dda_0625 [Drechslerella dactyloides]|uniref:Uncharacterized protein n=1 Tax=Drechslerella dactyloides TaxID=74499 RepID=A0AAD6J4X6_DREDA|nr:hypothetical protein Dda_0625 [Drechslerella dactyloides]
MQAQDYLALAGVDLDRLIKLPGELQDDILAQLPPGELVRLLRSDPPVHQRTLGSWNLTLFSAEHLIHLYEWNAEAVDNHSQAPSNQNYVLDIRARLITQLRRSLRALVFGAPPSDGAQRPLRFTSLSIYYHQIEKMFENSRSSGAGGGSRNGDNFPPDDEIISFIRDFTRKKRTVQDFCAKLYDLDRFLKVCRERPKFPISDETERSLLFCWSAMEFIISGNGRMVTRYEIPQRWSQFEERLARIFDGEGRSQLRQTAMLQGELARILGMYCNFIGDCNASFLEDIYTELLPKHDQAKLECYAMFTLSHGFERALRLLEQEHLVIEFLKDQNCRHVRAWGKFRKDVPLFYVTDIPETNQPVL